MRMLLSVVLLVALSPTPLFAATPLRSDLPEGISFLIHVNVDSLRGSDFGKDFIQKIVQLPSVQKHVASMPESLTFLKDVRVHGVTVFGFPASDTRSDEPVCLVRLDVDQQKLVQLLALGRDYARVDYQGVEIHHWNSNMEEALGNIVLDRKAKSDDDASGEDSEDEKDKYRVAYLAIPSPGVVIVSPSLPHLTAAIDRQLGRKDMLAKKRFQQWAGADKSWFLLAIEDAAIDFPSNLVARVSEGADGRINIHAETTCRSDVEKQIGHLAFAALTNADQLGPCLTGLLPAKSGKKVAESEKGEAKKPKKRRGELKFGITVDHMGDSNNDNEEGLANENMIREITKFLSRLVTATFDDGRLVANATAYPGSWDIDLKSKNNTDSINIVLNLFSTKAKLATARDQSKTRR